MGATGVGVGASRIGGAASDVGGAFLIERFHARFSRSPRAADVLFVKQTPMTGPSVLLDSPTVAPEVIGPQLRPAGGSERDVGRVFHQALSGGWPSIQGPASR